MSEESPREFSWNLYSPASNWACTDEFMRFSMQTSRVFFYFFIFRFSLNAKHKKWNSLQKNIYRLKNKCLMVSPFSVIDSGRWKNILYFNQKYFVVWWRFSFHFTICSSPPFFWKFSSARCFLSQSRFLSLILTNVFGIIVKCKVGKFSHKMPSASN